MSQPEAFYLPEGDRFVSTLGTRGPWDERAQHGGPPIALAATVIQQRHPREGMQVVRVTAEILRPIPVATLDVTTNVVRPGKSIEVIDASLSADGEEVLRARLVRIRTTPPLTFEREFPRIPPPAGLDETHPPHFFPTRMDVGYHTSMEVRFVRGDFMEPGPALGWGRMRIPLIAGTETLPFARVLILADSGNGISGELDYRKWIFINPETTVYLHRMPVGEWIAMDARTIVEPNGIGLAQSVLYDQTGAVGTGHQSLFVAPRPV